MSNLYVYLIRSRNKDNKDIPNFKERVATILEYKENEDKVIEAFKSFAAEGVPSEQTRLYRSVNSSEYYGSNVPLFRRNGYRQSGAMIP